MRATHLIAAMLGVVAAASLAMLVLPGFAGSAQQPMPVIEFRCRRWWSASRRTRPCLRACWASGR